MNKTRENLLESDWIGDPDRDPPWSVGDIVHTGEALEVLKAGGVVQGPQGNPVLWELVGDLVRSKDVEFTTEKWLHWNLIATTHGYHYKVVSL